MVRKPKREVLPLGAAVQRGDTGNAFLMRVITQQDTALRRYLSARLGNRADVADCMQEVYLRLAALDRNHTVVPTEAFVFKIASNLLKDRYRRSRVRKTDRHVSLDGIDIEAQQSSPESAAEAGQDLETVVAAIEELSPSCRNAFLLHRLAGKTHAQIAVELGVSVSMVEKHIIHAMAHIHENLFS